jgi:hypothetical protein
MVRQMKGSAIQALKYLVLLAERTHQAGSIMAKKTRRSKSSQSSAPIGPSERHPIFGALKGSTFIAPGVDLTEPADPEWGKVYDDVPATDSTPQRNQKPSLRGAKRRSNP